MTILSRGLSKCHCTPSGESILLANTPEPLAAPSTGMITRSKLSNHPRKSYRTRSTPSRSACKTPNRRAKAASFSDTKSSRDEQNSPHSTDRDPDKLFVIDSLLKCKETKGNISYLVHWKGYNKNQSTWEPKEALPTALIDEFHRKSKPSKRTSKKKKLKDSLIRVWKELGVEVEKRVESCTRSGSSITLGTITLSPFSSASELIHCLPVSDDDGKRAFASSIDLCTKLRHSSKSFAGVCLTDQECPFFAACTLFHRPLVVFKDLSATTYTPIIPDQPLSHTIYVAHTTVGKRFVPFIPVEYDEPPADAKGDFSAPFSSPADPAALPTFKPAPPVTGNWGESKAIQVQASFQNAILATALWRKNIFTLPSGHVGNLFVKEKARLFEAVVNETPLQGVAMAAAVVMETLLLQRTSQHSRSKDNSKTFTTPALTVGKRED